MNRVKVRMMIPPHRSTHLQEHPSRRHLRRLPALARALAALGSFLRRRARIAKALGELCELRDLGYSKAAEFLKKHVRFTVTFAELALKGGDSVYDEQSREADGRGIQAVQARVEALVDQRA